MRATRTTLELTLNPGYVRNWGAWEAIRELLQNAQDAHDIGRDMEVNYITNTKEPMLRIVNQGVVIDRETLLMGTTSKAEDNRQRGKFGEGFKLAWLVLSRMGFTVRCRSGAEQWIPHIEHSDQFGAEVLKVECSPVKYRNAIQVDVIGLGKEDWDEIKERCLFLSKIKKADMIDLDYDRILTAEDKVGVLYVKGVYVGRLPGRYFYGYDLDDVDLDRDRRLADPWSLKYAITKVLNKALSRKMVKTEDIWQLLQNDEWEEGRAVRDNLYTNSTISTAMAKIFTEKHGDEAVPVSSSVETMDAKHYGIKGVAVGRTLKAVIEKETGSYESKQQQLETQAKHIYSLMELEAEEQVRFEWAVNLVKEHCPGHEINIVDFYSDAILGRWQGDGRIELARRTLTDRKQLISTLVHELAHDGGLEDGSVEHRDACDELFAKIICALSA